MRSRHQTFGWHRKNIHPLMNSIVEFVLVVPSSLLFNNLKSGVISMHVAAASRFTKCKIVSRSRYWKSDNLIPNVHDEVIKWKHFPRYWPFVRGIHRSPLNSPHKGQWRGALMFSLIYSWINGWVNNGKAGDLRRHRAHYDVRVFLKPDIQGGHSIQGCCAV